MQPLLKQPLLHFLLLGALLFGLFTVVEDTDVRSDREYEILITPGRIETLSSNFEKVWQRPPNEQELKGLVNEFIQEEIFYREALAIGLDQDDTIIRRRLRQKLEFVTTDLSVQREPTTEELQQYLDENSEPFRVPSLVSFKQVYLNPDVRSDSLESDLARIRQGLTAAPDAGLDGLGDHFMYGNLIESAPEWEINRMFGADFRKALLQLDVGKWLGPVESGYGQHLVRVTDRRDGRPSKLEEVREAVVRDWSALKRREAEADFYEGMKKNYNIVVEWPES